MIACSNAVQMSCEAAEIWKELMKRETWLVQLARGLVGYQHIHFRNDG